MADKYVAAAVVLVGVLALRSCSQSDPITGAKVAAGTAIVAGGVAGGAAVGGAAGGLKRGASKRVEDAVSGRNRPDPRPPVTTPTTRPQPVPVTTTTAQTFGQIRDCVSISLGICVPRL